MGGSASLGKCTRPCNHNHSQDTEHFRDPSPLLQDTLYWTFHPRPYAWQPHHLTLEFCLSQNIRQMAIACNLCGLASHTQNDASVIQLAGICRLLSVLAEQYSHLAFKLHLC